METSDTSIVALYRATSLDGKPFFAFVAIAPSNYLDFQKAVASGDPMDVTSFGEVLETGWGDEPDEQTLENMRENYGCDPDFEQKLLNAIEG